MSTSRTHRLAVAAAISALAIALTGCVAEAPMPAPTPTPTDSIAPTNTPNPQLRPGDTAAANQQFFDHVNSTFYAANGKSDGRTIVDNLVTAGFRKQDIEVTFDTTPTNRPVDSIVFSVRVKGECLVGQFGPNGYVGRIEPLLGTGGCLVGHTRPIDW
jgi:hypothetical protein